MLAFDYIKLTPAILPPPLSPYEQWQAAEFGINTNNPSHFRRRCHPDSDGVPNLMEYALGRNPLVADATNLTTIGTNSNYLTLVITAPKSRRT